MRFAFLALLAGFLSCQTATQITVKLRGVGVSCPSGSAPTIEQTGVLAKPKLQSPADMSELSVLGEQCAAAEESVVSLGDIVLVPADGPGPVEVLALGALKVGEGAEVSAEQCRAEYERLFGAPCEVGEGKACESCIFARRSVAFVKRSKLEITIDLDASCAGVVCDPSQTCSKGGCVSAEASCEDDGSCTLVNENQGGAGGQGGGLIGGGGGGGGGPADPWQPIWEPSTVSCPTASPHDVVGTTLQGNTTPTLFVAAGACVLELQPDGVSTIHEGPGVDDTIYRSVAVRPGQDVAVFGDRGAALWSQDRGFTTLTAPSAAFDLSADGSSWDIALLPQNQFAWTRTPTSGPGQIRPFLPQASSQVKRAALYTVFPSAQDAQPATFGAWGTTLAAQHNQSASDSTMTGSESGFGWSLWAVELKGTPFTAGVVAVNGSTDRLYYDRCTAPTTGCALDSSGRVSLDPFPSTAEGRKVTAIWGTLAGTDMSVYAVGEDDADEPWLGRTTFSTEADVAAIDWNFSGVLPAPVKAGGAGAIESIWVGPTDSTSDEWVVVVGPSGVFRARVEDVFAP